MTYAFLKTWCGGAWVPKAAECVGSRLPSFLGGPDEVASLEIADAEVYWVISGQLLCGVSEADMAHVSRRIEGSFAIHNGDSWERYNHPQGV